MIHRRGFGLLAFAVALTATAAVQAQSTLIPLSHYRLGEEDLGTPTPGGAPENGFTLDEIQFNGIFRDMIATGAPVYSDFASPGGYSSLAMQFDGNSYFTGPAESWFNQPAPGSTFRIGMEAWVWVDPTMQGFEFVPFSNGNSMGFIGTDDGHWKAYGTAGFPNGGEIKYGEWQHIAFATNGSQWNFYLDGVQTVSAHGGTYGGSSGSSSIGADGSGSRAMVGYVDEARMFRWGNILPNQLNLQIDDLLIYSGLTKGDVNGDGVVDVADYDIWRTNVGTDISDLTGIESLVLGNVNHDDRIDLDDFALIKASQTPGAAPVPEPATWAIAAVGLCLLGGRHFARRGGLKAIRVASFALAIAVASVSQAQLTAVWDGTDGNWTGPHWIGGSGPNGAPTSVDTAEFNGGTATINTNVGQYAQLVTKFGGTINIAPTGSVIFDNVNLGATGSQGTGVINLQGSLEVPGTLSLALGDTGNGNATSELNITGAGKLRTPTLDAFWATPGARVSVTGPSTDVEVDDFILGISTLVSNITGLAHAPIKATNTFDIFAEGSVLPGSKLEVSIDLGDELPTLGHSWSLVETPVFTNAAVGVTSNAVFKPENVKIGFLDAPGLRAELAYKPGGSLGQVMAIDVLNNLNLRIDPSTGAATLENPTVGGDAFDIDGIMISSASGSLSAEGFDGLGLAGWQPGLNQSPSVLTESSLFSATSIAVGESFDLGTIFDVGSAQDLVFEFHVAGGKTIRGTVEYVAGPEGQDGDTDGDGDVDLDDLNAVRNNFGGTGTVGSTPGDAYPFDGEVNLDDLNAVRNNFGATASQSVPEPATAVLAIGLVVGALGFARKRR